MAEPGPTESRRLTWQGAYVQGSVGLLHRQAGSATPGWAAPEGTGRPLLAGQLAVEAGQGNGKGLQRAQRVVVIHGEHVLCYAAKLHHDVVRWSQAEVRTERRAEQGCGRTDGHPHHEREERRPEAEMPRRSQRRQSTDQTGAAAGESKQVTRRRHTAGEGKGEGRPFRRCPTPETLPRAQNPGSGLQRRLFQGLPVIKVTKPSTNPITHSP